MAKRLSVRFASHCAWRATYLYHRDRQFFHIGIDPQGATGPELFAALTIQTERRPPIMGLKTWFYKRVRFTIPHVRWQYPMSGLKLKLYQAQQAFLHRVDGRYGKTLDWLGE